MKRRDFIIKSTLAGVAITSPQIFSLGRNNAKVVVGNPLRFPPLLQSGRTDCLIRFAFYAKSSAPEMNPVILGSRSGMLCGH